MKPAITLEELKDYFSYRKNNKKSGEQEYWFNEYKYIKIKMFIDTDSTPSNFHLYYDATKNNDVKFIYEVFVITENNIEFEGEYADENRAFHAFLRHQELHRNKEIDRMRKVIGIDGETLDAAINTLKRTGNNDLATRLKHSKVSITSILEFNKGR